MNSWIFQGNPNHLDVNKKIKSHDDMLWTVRQENYKEDIQPGDEVFIWRASGDENFQSGVIAEGEIMEKPKMQKHDEKAEDFFKTDDLIGEQLRVRFKITKRNLSSKEIVKKKWCEDDPILNDLRILKLAVETNYKLPRNQAERLKNLVRNTGIDWTYQESIASLWAYKETSKIGTVSKKPGTPVATVALAIGRYISDVYNKVMNFRHIDLEEPDKKGFEVNNELNEKVWEEFFDENNQQLNEQRLDQKFKSLWGQATSDESNDQSESLDSPPDDPDELQQFARRIRKGQGEFREKLLKLYDNKCAVTGDGPEEVLHACHLIPHSETGKNDLKNGIVLRADIHELFDEALIKIHPENYRIEIEQELMSTSYSNFNGKKIRERTNGEHPASEYLNQKFNDND